MMKVEIDFLMRNRQHADVISSLPLWVEQVTSGNLPHCNDMLATLMVRLAKGG